MATKKLTDAEKTIIRTKFKTDFNDKMLAEFKHVTGRNPKPNEEGNMYTDSLLLINILKQEAENMHIELEEQKINLI